MKNLFSIAFLAIVISGYAQTDLPKTALDVSPLLIGEKIENLSLQTVEGNKIELSTLFQKKRTVLVFYRGGWCPYCNVQLSALVEAEKTLLDLGYQIVAISPDAPENLKVTGEKDKVNYLLLSDSNGALSKATGIAFQAPQGYEPYITEGSKGVNKNFLPVPSVFIVDLNGTIRFEHITPDFKNRITNDLLVSVAKSLK